MGTSTEEVIVLSVSETQALRAKLGLPPLRGAGVPSSSSNAAAAAAAGNGNGNGNGGAQQQQQQHHDNDAFRPKSSSGNDEELSLSVSETNALRLKIGLPPLRTSADNITKKRGSSSSTAIHAPPANLFAENEARKRIEDSKAKREAGDRLRKLERENNEAGGGAGEESGSALDFAKKLMAGNNEKKGVGSKNKNNNNDNGDDENNENKKGGGKKKKRRKKKKLLSSINPQLFSLGDDDDEEEEEASAAAAAYTEADLKGIKVAHSAADFAAGSTTVLTLADKSILEVDEDSKKATGLLHHHHGGENNGNNELRNVNMDHDSGALRNLKRRRAIEMGAGRAGGYAGYDDDEFEELGGVGVGVVGGGAMARGGNGGGGSDGGRGFEIGGENNDAAAAEGGGKTNGSDIFSTFSGGAVSLRTNSQKVASDFLTRDEDEEIMESKGEKLERERKKQQRILEKLRKKDKKKAKKAKKNRKGRKRVDDDDDDSDEETNEGGGNEGTGYGGSLLASLEATAVQNDKRKRRRRGDEATDENNIKEGANVDHSIEAADNVDDLTAKRQRFDKIMEKGKVRTDRAFNTKKATSSTIEAEDDEEGEDDAFLNAALAKARRLKRLKELNGGNNANKNSNEKKNIIKVEDAVFKAVEKLKQQEEVKVKQEGGNLKNDENGGGLTFEFDEMQEFTRALRAREDQAKRAGGGAEKQKKRGVTISSAKESEKSKTINNNLIKSENNAEEEGPVVEDVDMEELAQEVKEDDNDNSNDNAAAFGSTAESAPIGRGMSSFLSLLKQTGEISKHSGKEEMRGRAKDKRTYEDYEQLDLKKVVQVNPTPRGGTHEKDAEFANREIKLEYRDAFGRLLTRKEAYRDMCYQFHGHGSSKKNQERRLKQVEREREEGKLASNVGGTLGALKKTQKATGKAFIIHKT